MRPLSISKNVYDYLNKKNRLNQQILKKNERKVPKPLKIDFFKKENFYSHPINSLRFCNCNNVS